MNRILSPSLLSALPARSNRGRSGARLRYPLLLAAGGVIAACSSPPPDAGSPGETSVGTSRAAFSTQTENGVFTNADLTNAIDATNLYGSTFAYANGQMEFLPDVCGLVSLGSLFNFPSGQGGFTFAVPTTVPGIPTVCPTYTATINSFSSTFGGTTPFGGAPNSQSCGTEKQWGDLGDASGDYISLTPAGVQIRPNIYAEVHLAPGGGYSLCPSGDFSTSSGVSVTLAWQWTTQEFTLANVNSTLQFIYPNGQVLNGALGTVMSGVNGAIDGLLPGPLNGALSNANAGVPTTIANGLYELLAAEWNLKHQGDLGGGVAWVVVPGTVHYDNTNSQFTFQVSRDSAPPPNCSFSFSCGGMIQFGCTLDNLLAGATNGGTADPIAISENGQVVYQAASAISANSTIMQGSLAPPSGATSGTFLGCTVFPGGQTCDPTPVTVQFTAPASCSCVPTTSCTGLCGAVNNGCGGLLYCPACAPSPPVTSCGTPAECCAKAHGRYETSPPPARCVIE
jgi:hypothetical protein